MMLNLVETGPWKGCSWVPVLDCGTEALNLREATVPSGKSRLAGAVQSLTL